MKKRIKKPAAKSVKKTAVKTAVKIHKKQRARPVPFTEAQRGLIAHEYAFSGCCVKTAWKACRKNYSDFQSLTTLRIHRLLRSENFGRLVTRKIAARILDEHTKRQIDPATGLVCLAFATAEVAVAFLGDDAPGFLNFVSLQFEHIQKKQQERERDENPAKFALAAAIREAVKSEY